jgi:hypothetical protein
MLVQPDGIRQYICLSFYKFWSSTKFYNLLVQQDGIRQYICMLFDKFKLGKLDFNNETYRNFQ